MAHKLRGDEIERLRLANRLSKGQLAMAALVDIRTLNRWLKGEHASDEGLRNLAKALGVEPGLLIEGRPKEPERQEEAPDRELFPPTIVEEDGGDRFSLCIKEWMTGLNRSVEKLTRDQHRVIQGLEDCRRARIGGCAGSGKTMVAAEKAARCSLANSSTLFLCHSPRLAEHVRGLLRRTRVRVEDFGDWVRGLAGTEPALRNGPWTSFDEPDDAMLELAEAALNAGAKRYGVIVVDEGQDFRKEWWTLVEAALLWGKDSSLYIFHDDRQAFLRGRCEYPEAESILDLSKNCRNGGKIFAAMRMIYPSPPPTEVQLKDAGATRVFPFERGSREASVSEAIDWIIREGFGGDVESAAGKVIGLHGGTTPLEKSPLLGTFNVRPLDWRTAVRAEFKRAVAEAGTLKFPNGGLVEVDRRLSGLSQRDYPDRADVELVRSLAKNFTVNPKIRRYIANRPSAHSGLKWLLSEGSATLSRGGFESFRTSEIIIHFEREDWAVGLPRPQAVTLDLGDQPVVPGRIPVYAVAEFKGLESGCIILLMEGASMSLEAEVYIGISRARHMLAVLLDPATKASLSGGLLQFLDADAPR